MKNKMNIILAAMFLFYALPVFAEKITLNSGKTVEGKIIERTNDKIKIDVGGIPITYYMDQIESIDGNKIKPSSIPEESADKSETKPEEKSTAPQAANTVDKSKSVSSCQDWINSKQVTDYFRQEQLITRELNQKGQVIIDRMNKKSEIVASLAQLKEIGLTASRKMNEIIPPEELTGMYKLKKQSLEYGQLAMEAAMNKDIDTANAYYIKQSEATKKANEELRNLYVAHSCSAEFVQQLDKIIAGLDNEIKQRSNKLKVQK
ncbi:MAG: hypothetical protein PHP17_04950 [Candidatus Omnitrophica bacterium]|nr:hypothetical protein [Candidatus Omnitrophota bacterium]